MLLHDLSSLLKWVLGIVWGELWVCREEAVDVGAIMSNTAWCWAMLLHVLCGAGSPCSRSLH